MASTTRITYIHSTIKKLRGSSAVWDFEAIAVQHIVIIGCAKKKAITFFKNVIWRYLCIW